MELGDQWGEGEDQPNFKRGRGPPLRAASVAHSPQARPGPRWWLGSSVINFRLGRQRSLFVSVLRDDHDYLTFCRVKRRIATKWCKIGLLCDMYLPKSNMNVEARFRMVHFRPLDQTVVWIGVGCTIWHWNYTAKVVWLLVLLRYILWIYI